MVIINTAHFIYTRECHNTGFRNSDWLRGTVTCLSYLASLTTCTWICYVPTSLVWPFMSCFFSCVVGVTNPCPLSTLDQLVVVVGGIFQELHVVLHSEERTRALMSNLVSSFHWCRWSFPMVFYDLYFRRKKWRLMVVMHHKQDQLIHSLDLPIKITWMRSS